MLLYRPQPWIPQDSLAVSIVASLELADSWSNVLARDEIWRARGPRCFDAMQPLSDGEYDVTSAGALDRTKRKKPSTACAIATLPKDRRIGSNSWASGGSLTSDGRALLAPKRTSTQIDAFLEAAQRARPRAVTAMTGRLCAPRRPR